MNEVYGLTPSNLRFVSILAKKQNVYGNKAQYFEIFEY